ncbi:mobilization protein [Pedobacter sp. PF22-3]|uniref:mobilization protein n=1 Tax=Pedobacter sp. PF22-3 TaxID=2994467 RepID=UPI00224769C2|nr:mobilization protein [Pedobacter sp. PF22-3]MCX2492625.1 mobilization protein [Pedobacter sp. PF22-3]
MPRPKIAEEQQLKHLLRMRVNQTGYQRLTTMQKQSDCRSICEIARKILSGERINLFQKDASMNGPMEELALIRKEIKAIGININQQTQYFHTSQTPAERAFYVNKTAELYKSIDQKTDRLLGIVTPLAELWLQK